MSQYIVTVKRDFNLNREESGMVSLSSDVTDDAFQKRVDDVKQRLTDVFAEAGSGEILNVMERSGLIVIEAEDKEVEVIRSLDNVQDVAPNAKLR